MIVTGEEDGVVSVTGAAGGLRETVKLWSPSSASSSSMVMVKQSVSPVILPAAKNTSNSVVSVTVKSSPSTVGKTMVNKSSHSLELKQTT